MRWRSGDVSGHPNYQIDQAVLGSDRPPQIGELGRVVSLVRLEIDRADRLANRRVVLLDAAPEVLAPRCVGKFRTMAAPSFLARIRNRFLEVFAKLPGTVVIDCSGPIDSVLREVSMVVADALPTVRRPDAA